jgi:hypothetical protein
MAHITIPAEIWHPVELNDVSEEGMAFILMLIYFMLMMGEDAVRTVGKYLLNYTLLPPRGHNLRDTWGYHCTDPQVVMLCSPVEVNRRDNCFNLVFRLTLIFEVTCSSETSVDFQRITQHYIQDDADHSGRGV